MAVSLDDDVPDDTTAAGIAPATSGADEEDRTVQQLPDPKPSARAPNARPPPAPARAQVAVPSPNKPAAMPAMNVTSKRMTVVGLAPPGAPPPPIPAITNGPVTVRNVASASPAVAKGFGASVRPEPKGVPVKPPSGGAKATPAKPVAAAQKAAKPEKSEAEEDDGSITATAPAPRVPSTPNAIPLAIPVPTGPVSSKPLISPLSVPMGVQIREMPPAVPPAPPKPPAPPAAHEEPMDETEVRTVVAGPENNPAAATASPRPGAAPARPPAPAKEPPQATIITAEDVQDDDELEDSVTTQAPAQVSGTLPEEDEPKTSPPMRMPPPIPAAGRSPFDQPPIPSPAAGAATTPAEDDDAYNAEESVTTRGPAIPDFRLDDSSVTADAPVVDNPPESSGRWPSPVQGKNPATMSQALGLPPAIEDRTEGTTNRLAGLGPNPNPHVNANPGGPPRPRTNLASTQQSPQTPPGSITSEAQMQHGLRVINRGPPVLNSAPVQTLDDDDEEEGESKTAVMIGAPIPPNTPRGARQQLVMGGGHAGAQAHAHALGRDPSSDSGLRVHEPQPQQMPPQPQNDHHHLGAMMAGALHQHGAASDRGSGVAPHEYPSQPMPLYTAPMHGYPPSEPMMALGATIPANSPHYHNMHLGTAPQMQQYDFASTIKKPRYGLLVGLVALLSFAIPLVLFLWLHQNVQEPYARTPNEVSSDRVVLAPPEVSAKAAASASASSTKPGHPPHHR